jgi:soluble lytic murein transglycosylase-like protein
MFMVNIKAKNLVIPGILAAVFLLIILTRMISTPAVVWAFSSTQPELFSAQPKNEKDEISFIFPSSVQQWKMDIEKQARQLDVDANLIAAVILQESGGDPLAFSVSGAVGLMQVMPRDGLAASFYCNGKSCFQSRPSIQELSNPQFNIEYGTGMLKNLFTQFGSWREALHAYGPIDVGYDYADRVLLIRDQYS